MDNVRRALEDWFGFDVAYCMNVTDVDDKIIRKARQGWLLQEFRTSERGADAACVREEVDKALAAAIADQRAKAEAAEAAAAAGAGGRAAKELADAAAADAFKLAALEASASAVASCDGTVDALLAAGGDALAASLDARSGASVADPAIFRAHAAMYEAEFMADMESLRVRPPDVLTRVSEYIPEIVAYVDRIVGAGFAYPAAGDVYFDVASFRGAGYPYGRLRPWSVGTALAADGEAPATAPGGKRSPADFALWKAARPGEPAWESPWGPGRPGWHIECSAMATAILGDAIDIHSGGEDLAFPHHDNEIAQADAFGSGGKACCAGRAPQWVNYFLHAGHLSIDGLKMSKSLKNFVTIRHALAHAPARVLRIVFASTRWDRPMLYSDAALDDARRKDACLARLFHVVAASGRRAGGGDAARWDEPERALAAAVAAASDAAHAAFCDSVDTKAALDAVLELGRAVAAYASACAPARRAPRALLLRRAGALATKVLRVLGVSTAPAGGVGLGGEREFGEGAARAVDAVAALRDAARAATQKESADRAALAAAAADAAADAEAQLGVRVGGGAWAPTPGASPPAAEAAPFLGVLASLHEAIVAAATAGDGAAAAVAARAATDATRNDTLAAAGVRLEDAPDGGSCWFPEDPAVLAAEAAARRSAEAGGRARKARAAVDAAAREVAKLDLARQQPRPEEALKDKYSKFGPGGDPTHGADGAELDAKAAAKAKKEADKKRRARAPWDDALAKDPQAWERAQAKLVDAKEAAAEAEAVVAAAEAG
jgi:cysteinyl-tRNA synthetase